MTFSGGHILPIANVSHLALEKPAPPRSIGLSHAAPGALKARYAAAA
jgi:hypothetical protein